MKKLIYMMVGVILLAGCGAMSPDGDAGENQTVTLGESVTLDGTESDEKNGDSLDYDWAIVGAPAESSAELTNPESARPTFTPDVAGTYVFELIVDNGFHESEPVRVTVECQSPGETSPDAIASDPSGDISVYTLKAIENYRGVDGVNFSLEYTIENASNELANVSFFLYGVDSDDVDVFAHKVETAIDSNEQRVVVISFGTVLTAQEFDSLETWEVDQITLTDLSTDAN